MQLHTGEGTTGRLLFLGDLAYPTIKKIFDYSEFHGRTDRIEWGVLLSPHHDRRPYQTGRQMPGNGEPVICKLTAR